jgi:hypothetical protein
MTQPYPDLEIYIKRVEPEQVVRWLEDRFELEKTQPSKDAVVCTLRGTTSKTMECVILLKAAKGGYASVWFKSNDTPWNTDKDCAIDAFDFFQPKEIRCSTGGWEGNDEGGWFRITNDGVQTVNWLI